MNSEISIIESALRQIAKNLSDPVSADDVRSLIDKLISLCQILSQQ